jgi:hypothetical protein
LPFVSVSDRWCRLIQLVFTRLARALATAGNGNCEERH